MTWRRGDLGRFSNESKELPRFELVGLTPDKKEVSVWYGGDAAPTNVPLQRFKQSCVNWWVSEVVRPVPEWVTPGVKFQIANKEASNLKRAVVRRSYGDRFTPSVHRIDVQGHTLTMRRRRFDHISCFDEDLRLLVLVPLNTVTSHAQPVRTFWDRLDDGSLVLNTATNHSEQGRTCWDRLDEDFLA
jgi:hypothetical protein